MTTELPKTCDVLIVGGGPAGLSAAYALRAAGAGDVHVIEREPEMGGIPRHCGHSPYGMREFHRLMGGARYARRLTERAHQTGAVLHCNTTVMALHPGGRVSVSGPEGLCDIQARAVLLATGARESSRVARFVGGTKPGGVLNTGSLQGLVYLDGLQPVRRPLIVGSELVSFSAFLTCRHAGARPVAMVEAGNRPTAIWPAHWMPRVLGTPVHFNTELTQIHGKARVEAVTLCRDGVSRDIEADSVIFTGKFRPENALLRQSHIRVDAATNGPEVDQFGRCSDPSYFAAGNVLRAIETAGWCWQEGRSVATAILAALKGRLPDRSNAHRLSNLGDPIAYAVPQLRVASAVPPAFEAVQLRFSRPARGTAKFGATSYRLKSRPERRITVPLPQDDTPMTLSFDEAT